MEFKSFTSDNGRFSLILPQDWEQYEDDDENTYAFFNSKSWTGNFRVTPQRWAKHSDPNDDKASEIILEELTENQNALRFQIGDFDCVYYKSYLKENDENYIIYYWTLGKKNDLFLCSFTCDKDQEETELHKSELQIVQNIIRSIKIN